MVNLENLKPLKTRRFALPPVKVLEGQKTTRWNARHTIFGVKIWREIPYPHATLCQETHEWRFLRLWGLLLGLPFFAIFGVTTYAVLNGAADAWLMLGVPSLFVGIGFQGKIMNAIGWLKRRMELQGHMLEAVVAEALGADFESKLAHEIHVLETGLSYEQFDGWDYARIANEIRKWEPWARKNLARFVAKHT